jgi:hypothetical protein
MDRDDHEGLLHRALARGDKHAKVEAAHRSRSSHRKSRDRVMRLVRDGAVPGKSKHELAKN